MLRTGGTIFATADVLASRERNMKTMAGFLGFVSIASFLCSGISVAQEPPLQQLRPAAILPVPPGPVVFPPGDTTSYLGGIFDIDDRTIVTGVSYGTAAHVYRLEPGGVWRYAARLPIPDGEVWFNHAEISGDTILISVLTVSEVGVVYVYTLANGTWTLRQRLTEPEPEAPTQALYFGYELALHGDTAVITNFTDGNGLGAAYLYRKSPSGRLRYIRKLVPDSAQSGAFGWSVSIDERSLAIGAPGGGVTGGSVYLFRRTHDRWSPEQTINSHVPTNPEGFQGYFGNDVAVSGDTLLVADPNAGLVFQPQFKTGAAFVFTRRQSGWRLQQELASPHPGSLGLFGQAVAIVGHQLIVSGWGSIGSGVPSSERIYVFDRCSGGPWRTDTFMSEGDGEDAFGYSLAVSRRLLVTSAPTKPTEDDTLYEGEVQVFEIPRCGQ
jgi:hypothetical protein